MNQNIFELKSSATKEAYSYFDKNIRNLPRDKNGDFESDGNWSVDNDVDAFRHAYVSGVFTQEFGGISSKVYGNLNEWTGGNGSSSSNSNGAKNMDYWNNSIGRKYGKKTKSRSELARLLKEALERGELITTPTESRKYKGNASGYSVDTEKPVIVLKENETGRNELFLDLVSGEVMDREVFVGLIESGAYPGYTIGSIDEILTPMSKPDGVAANNLG